MTTTITTAVWPDTLPLEPEADSYEEEIVDNVIRSEVDAGPSKQRPGSTGLQERLKVSYVLTDTQKVAFKDFLKTIGGGARPFHYIHPTEGTLIIVQIVGQIQPMKRVSANNWLVSYSLEIVPS